MIEIEQDPQARATPAAETGNALWNAVIARALNDPIWAGTPWLLRRKRREQALNTRARDRGGSMLRGS